MARRFGIGLLLGVLVACSSDDGGASPTTVTSPPQTTSTTAPPISFPEWQERATAVCVAHNQEIDQGEPTTMEELTASFDSLISVIQPYVEELTAIKVPSEREDEVRLFYELWQTGLAKLVQARDGAAQGSLFQTQQALAEIESELAGQDPLFDELLPGCA